METVKDILKFCNEAVFYDYKNIGIEREINQVRTFKFNRFYETIPYTRILVSLSIIDDIILKINSTDIENILDENHNLRENIIFMLSFGKTVRDEVRDEQQKVDDNNE